MFLDTLWQLACGAGKEKKENAYILHQKLNRKIKAPETNPAQRDAGNQADCHHPGTGVEKDITRRGSGQATRLPVEKPQAGSNGSDSVHDEWRCPGTRKLCNNGANSHATNLERTEAGVKQVGDHGCAKREHS